MRTAAAPLALISFALSLATAPAAMARPAGFGCLWPVNNLAINPERSRFYYDHTEWVFDLKVHLNEPADGGGIAVGRGSPHPKQIGVCKIVLPVMDSLRQRVYWREAPDRTADRAVFEALDIREAGEGRSFTEWLVLRPLSAKVSGATTIEFHVESGYSSDAE